MYMFQNKTEKKMEKKAIKGVLVGYDFGGYRVWTQGRKIIRSRDVIFNEKPMIPEITINLPSGSKERQEDETHSFSDPETG